MVEQTADTTLAVLRHPDMSVVNMLTPLSALMGGGYDLDFGQSKSDLRDLVEAVSWIPSVHKYISARKLF